jgi:D-sedoheptulose 7-phosphate isomerase
MAFDLNTYINTYKEKSSTTVSALPAEDIRKAVELLHTARKRGSHIFVVGNGGSASTATHFACDLFKWATAEGKQPIKAFALNENIPLVSALVNDNGFSEIFVEQLKTLAKPGDVIVGFSVHGGTGKDKAGLWSQNLTKAIQYMKDIGGHAIGVTGFDGGIMKEICDVNINVPADSTPHVEGLHGVISHLLADGLKELALHEHEQSTSQKTLHRK